MTIRIPVEPTDPDKPVVALPTGPTGLPPIFGGGGTLYRDPIKGRVPRQRTLDPLSPLNFYVEKYGNGVRVNVVDRDHENAEAPGSGAAEYHIHWAADVDVSTDASTTAGFTRSILLAPAIPAPGRAGALATAIYADPQYVTGWFYCTGVDKDGKRSTPTRPVQITSGIGGTIPGDVKHFRLSESGEANGQGVLSKISYAFECPDSIVNVARFQFYFRNYPTLNQVSEGISIQRTSGAGGSQTGDIRLPVARRVGAGTISISGADVTGVGTNFLSLAAVAGGDYLEVLGTRVQIASVTSNTVMTLSASWAGPAVVAVASWLVIGSVTIYCVSVGYDGSRRDDWENAPSDTVLLDGELSAPLAPGTVTVTPVATGVRVAWSQVAGTELRGYNVYRSDGLTPDTGMASQPPLPSSGTILISGAAQNPNLPEGSGFVAMQFDDTNFTAYELETNAVFTWYVTTTNVRGDESDAANDSGACRAVLPNEIDPTLPTLVDPKNYIYNSTIYGTPTNQVLANDTSQDTYTGADASNLPGRPFQSASGQADGTGRFQGYTRLESNDGGTGAAGTVTFNRNNEIVFPAAGVAKAHFVYGEVGAWDHGTAVFRKIEKGATYVLSFFARHTGVTADGTFSVFVQQMNDGTSVGDCLLRTRASDGTLSHAAGSFEIDASQFVSYYIRYYAIFKMDSTLANTKQLHYNFSWSDGTVGEVSIEKIAFQRGEIPPPWTSDMGDTTISIPNPTFPTDPVGDNRRERFGDIYGIMEP
jgi:hypothetical protein